MQIKGVKWLDDDTLDDEMSDIEFQKKIIEEGKTRDFKKYGRDGTFGVWKKTFTHRRLKFDIVVIRYYVIGEKILQSHGKKKSHDFKMGTSRNMWVVLEHPKSMETIVGFVNKLESQIKPTRYEFLYADTLHSWNDGQTLKQRFEIMYKQGISDIDWWLDEAEKDLERYIKELKKEFKELRKIV